MAKVLFIASHRPDRSPNQRFRFEQYIPHLEKHGYQCRISYIVEEGDDRYLYKPGNLLRKLGFVFRSIIKRMGDLRISRDQDIIFICREALMSRGSFFEERFRKSGARIIYDLDDSIWLSNVSDANKRWAWVKDPGKTSRIIRLADLVFAGNAYLADHVRRFNSRVEVIPTTIDTDEYVPRTDRPPGPICIGWSGSLTTIQHFQFALPALRAIKERYGDKVVFRVIGDGDFRVPELGIQGMPWRRDSEVKDLQAMDIGIMPLPDDEWARGKCGLKGLQYMALGIPTIMSPVGVNSTIIQDGVNGFLADGVEEWITKLAVLMEDAELRRRTGEEARRSVVENWSVNAWKARYVQLFDELLNQGTDHVRPEENRAHAHP